MPAVQYSAGHADRKENWNHRSVLMLEKGIYTVNQYGRIKCRLKQFLKERDMTRNKLARMTGTRFEVIDRWYKGDVEKMDMDVLARICFVLSCSPSDIIEYVPCKTQREPAPDAES